MAQGDRSQRFVRMVSRFITLWTCITRTAPESQPWTIPIITPGLRQSKSVSLDLIRRKLAVLPELSEFL